LAVGDAGAQWGETPPPPAPPDPLQAVWIRAAAGLGAAMAADDVGRETLAPYVRKARTSAGEGRGGERAGGRSRVRSCAGEDAGYSAVASGDVSELSQKSEREGTEINGGRGRRGPH
jgi:hypothetical protein